jgi:hypothetical protein
MDGDHSRLYGYGFSYMYLKQPVLALGFSGARVCSPTLRLRGLLLQRWRTQGLRTSDEGGQGGPVMR